MASWCRRRGSASTLPPRAAIQISPLAGARDEATRPNPASSASRSASASGEAASLDVSPGRSCRGGVRPSRRRRHRRPEPPAPEDPAPPPAFAARPRRSRCRHHRRCSRRRSAGTAAAARDRRRASPTRHAAKRAAQTRTASENAITSRGIPTVRWLSGGQFVKRGDLDLQRCSLVLQPVHVQRQQRRRARRRHRPPMIAVSEVLFDRMNVGGRTSNACVISRSMNRRVPQLRHARPAPPRSACSDPVTCAFGARKPAASLIVPSPAMMNVL